MRDTNEAVERFFDMETIEEVDTFTLGYINSISRSTGSSIDIYHWCDSVSEGFQGARLTPSSIQVFIVWNIFCIERLS